VTAVGTATALANFLTCRCRWRASRLWCSRYHWRETRLWCSRYHWRETRLWCSRYHWRETLRRFQTSDWRNVRLAGKPSVETTERFPPAFVRRIRGLEPPVQTAERWLGACRSARNLHGLVMPEERIHFTLIGPFFRILYKLMADGVVAHIGPLCAVAVTFS